MSRYFRFGVGTSILIPKDQRYSSTSYADRIGMIMARRGGHYIIKTDDDPLASRWDSDYVDERASAMTCQRGLVKVDAAD